MGMDNIENLFFYYNHNKKRGQQKTYPPDIICIMRLKVLQGPYQKFQATKKPLNKSEAFKKIINQLTIQQAYYLQKLEFQS